MGSKITKKNKIAPYEIFLTNEYVKKKIENIQNTCIYIDGLCKLSKNKENIEKIIIEIYNTSDFISEIENIEDFKRCKLPFFLYQKALLLYILINELIKNKNIDETDKEIINNGIKMYNNVKKLYDEYDKNKIIIE
jgi:hypothetical protein